MKTECFNCGKEITFGFDLYSSVSISHIEEITHNSIYHKGDGLEQSATFCEDCKGAAEKVAVVLCKCLAGLKNS